MVRSPLHAARCCCPLPLLLCFSGGLNEFILLRRTVVRKAKVLKVLGGVLRKRRKESQKKKSQKRSVGVQKKLARNPMLSRTCRLRNLLSEIARRVRFHPMEGRRVTPEKTLEIKIPGPFPCVVLVVVKVIIIISAKPNEFDFPKQIFFWCLSVEARPSVQIQMSGKMKAV